MCSQNNLQGLLYNITYYNKNIISSILLRSQIPKYFNYLSQFYKVSLSYHILDVEIF